MKATIFALCLSPILSVGSIAIINNYHKWFPTTPVPQTCYYNGNGVTICQ